MPATANDIRQKIEDGGYSSAGNARKAIAKSILTKMEKSEIYALVERHFSSDCVDNVLVGDPPKQNKDPEVRRLLSVVGEVGKTPPKSEPKTPPKSEVSSPPKGKGGGKGGGNGGKGGRTKITDMVQIHVILAFVVQKLKKPVLAEIYQTLEDILQVDIAKNLIRRGLSGLNKADILATGNVMNATGALEPAWWMKTLWWSPSLELAYIVDLLPVLLSSPDTERLLAAFNAQEGKGGKKKKVGNTYGDYHAYELIVYMVDYLMGGGISCPAVNLAHDKFKRKPIEEMTGCFYIDPLTGEYCLTSDALVGWFRENCTRFSDRAGASAVYVAFDPIKFTPKRVIQNVLPVQAAGGKQAVPKHYETVEPGFFIKMRLSAPVRGGFTPAQMEKILTLALARPLRGLSPARGRKYGRGLVVSFKDMGSTMNGSDMSFILDLVPGRKKDDLPVSLMPEQVKYVEEAVVRLQGVDLAGIGPEPQGDNSAVEAAVEDLGEGP